MDALLSAAEVETIIREGLPEAADMGLRITEVGGGFATIRIPYSPRMLRPGDRVSGPTLFAAIDTAMYAAVLAHIGNQPMAVTSDMTLHFLRACAARDIIARAEVIKLGRRLAVLSVTVGADGDPPAVHATGSYALPPQKS
ncbi:PaaI family thioesterase [Algiphilus aromaticivorans]|uniref:PaaI family thioesterase n=1 Tax=Algiphilus aromaticivorans TaxID=382454 RepID=UPI0005C22FC4|nr:PaaI family thioesterase [Algiphilus aromaticivorans]